MATADVASFGTGKGRITGTLESIGEDGIIGWQSPYAKEPLKLRLDKLEQLEFSTTPGDKKPAPIQITLSNGDIIPVQRISGLEEAELVAETTASGALTLPRAAMASAQFGITHRRVLYSGFDNISEWTSGLGEPDNWQRRGNALVSSGPSIAARDCKLPDNFVLSFDLNWDSQSPSQSPSYSIGFADTMDKDAVKQNRYSFNFDGSFLGNHGSVFSTAGALLSIALNYRYLPIYEK